MFVFHYHCDMLLEVAEGRQSVCISVGAMQNDDDYYYFFLNSECKNWRVLFKGVTHYKECTFYISISHLAASQGLCLINLFTIAVQNIR